MRKVSSMLKVPIFIGDVLRARDEGVHLAILIYHRVLASKDPLRPDVLLRDQFARQMVVLRQYFKPISLREAVERLSQGTLEHRSVCVTFDDGYADNLSVAAPILADLGIPATVFVATGFLDGGVMWNDRVIDAVGGARGDSIDAGCAGLGVLPLTSTSLRQRALSALLMNLKHRPASERALLVENLEASAGVGRSQSPMLTVEQLMELSNMGVEIGAHTCSHPILSCESNPAASFEIAESKRTLEDVLKKPVDFFAYPNGRRGIDYDERHVRMVREAGFVAAVSTDNGVNRQETDLLQLHRFTPWDVSPLRFGTRLVVNERNVRKMSRV